MTNLELPDLRNMQYEGFSKAYTVKPYSEDFTKIIDESLPWIKFFICPYYSEAAQTTLLEIWYKNDETVKDNKFFNFD